MRLFKNKKTILLNARPQSLVEMKKNQVPDDFLTKCPHCHRGLVQSQIPADYQCYHCKKPLQFPARKRIEWLVDEDSFEEFLAELVTGNPLNFPNYEDKLHIAQQVSGLNEAVIIGKATLNQIPFAIGVMDSRFMMASMGTIVGEKITHLFEYATEHQLPIILFTASGGARMQEGILSLMQMAKISQAVEQHHQRGLFYTVVLTNPTTGGVTASFAMQGDMILAEPYATVGFAGKRVIEQTIKASLPEDFQSAEKVLEYGFIDSIVERSLQKQVLTLLLKIHQKVGE
ncbi:acetyl-CoA carboxylase, carboxyltransferase subunit beta [Tuanshanicoccus yangjingiae]|uniref:acetyl-CoA carboxylase, carboxyltransferase subunit beta n=1 Tax=Aerococcaceae bacterium zg-252 TaxID=2796928 RepID=UPI004064258F